MRPTCHNCRAIICGGRSTEVSVCSARYVYDAVDKSTYDISLIRVEKPASWTLLRSVAELQATPGFERFDTSLSAFQQSVVSESRMSRVLDCPLTQITDGD